MRDKPTKIREVDTSGITGVEQISVDLWYPRNEDTFNSIKISLMDVRAANDIVVSYDFTRDGWVVESDMDPGKTIGEYTQEEWDALPEVAGSPGTKDMVSHTLHEVAFIPAWPQKEEKSDEKL